MHAVHDTLCFIKALLPTKKFDENTGNTASLVFTLSLNKFTNYGVNISAQPTGCNLGWGGTIASG